MMKKIPKEKWVCTGRNPSSGFGALEESAVEFDGESGVDITVSETESESDVEDDADSFIASESESGARRKNLIRMSN
jgi:hypothetical protein